MFLTSLSAIKQFLPKETLSDTIVLLISILFSEIGL